ncbi:MAG: preprotein translocase subunit SecG [Limisphaerales bacterium]
MLTVLIWLLTAVLVITCLFLVLLVLVQLPKKEAGAGLAFGGAASDALFGAGSGTALTKVTKYAATTFFVVTLLLAVLHARTRHDGPSRVQELLGAPDAAAPTATAPAVPGTTPGTLPAPQAAPADQPPTVPAPATNAN